MSNYWQKKPFYIYRKLLFLWLLLWVTPLEAQNTYQLHFVSTHPKAKVSPESQIQIQQYARKLGLSVQILTSVHPLSGELPLLDYQDSLPYYSREMRRYRDLFFNSSQPKTAYDFYIFLTPDLIDTLASGFSLHGKHVLFVAANPSGSFADNFTKHFLVASSNIRGKDRESLDSLAQWVGFNDTLNRVRRDRYLFHDDTEKMGSKNGWVAYAFWEVDKKGNVKEAKLTLPFKLNFGKVNLDIDNYWLRPFYKSHHRFIAPIHVALVLLAFFIMLMFRKKVNERADKAIHFKSKFGFVLLRLALWIVFFVVGYLVFLTTDRFYKELFFNSANYKKLGNISTSSFMHHLTSSKTVVDQSVDDPLWEVYIKEKNVWKMQHRKKVLYFRVTLGSGNEVKKMKFLFDSNKIKLKDYQANAATHLIVKQFVDEKGRFLKEEVYNFANIAITDKFKTEDPPRKILLFVNGYRPVVNGGTPEAALSQIGQKGVEFPNSRNILFEGDRFEYWQPWGNFDQHFIDRIRPNEVYYADGHHSVATSNYGSVINFAQTSSIFPKPCKGTHHCSQTKNTTGTNVSTLGVLPFQSNKQGFNYRRNQGRIAGRNLYQLLNEVPGSSLNDTLFIVAHSMGYAYSLGLIDVLKGNCNLGSFYIFAPENAKAGRIRTSDWDEVYQYGSIPYGVNRQAPCLQDGVAPQTKVSGLPTENRLTFPLSYYKKMGFTGSHFIGYFDWVFDIPKGKKGAIRQR